MEHVNIPDSQLHEPKGVAFSIADRVYVADGSGSGVWKEVDAASIRGLLTNSTPAGRLVITGVGGGLDHREVLFNSNEVLYEGETLTLKVASLQNQINELEARVAALEGAP